MPVPIHLWPGRRIVGFHFPGGPVLTLEGSFSQSGEWPDAPFMLRKLYSASKAKPIPGAPPFPPEEVPIDFFQYPASPTVPLKLGDQDVGKTDVVNPVSKEMLAHLYAWTRRVNDVGEGDSLVLHDPRLGTPGDAAGDIAYNGHHLLFIRTGSMLAFQPAKGIPPKKGDFSFQITTPAASPHFVPGRNSYWIYRGVVPWEDAWAADAGSDAKSWINDPTIFVLGPTDSSGRHSSADWPSEAARSAALIGFHSAGETTATAHDYKYPDRTLQDLNWKFRVATFDLGDPKNNKPPTAPQKRLDFPIDEEAGEGEPVPTFNGPDEPFAIDATYSTINCHASLIVGTTNKLDTFVPAATITITVDSKTKLPTITCDLDNSHVLIQTFKNGNLIFTNDP